MTDAVCCFCFDFSLVFFSLNRRKNIIQRTIFKFNRDSPFLKDSNTNYVKNSKVKNAPINHRK